MKNLLLREKENQKQQEKEEFNIKNLKGVELSPL